MAQEPAETMAIRVFVVDDHEVVRRGVSELITSQPGLTVIGEADSVASAVPAIMAGAPDVAVLDVRLGDGSGLDICRQVTSQTTIPCLMLTSIVDDRVMVEAAEAGAAGFCLKSLGASSIVESIRKVAAGSQLLDTAELRIARKRMRESGEGLVESLTPQERRIFALIGEGNSNRQIGDEMFLAEKTVKNYVSNVLGKLGMARRTEVAALAARLDERESGWT